MAGGRLVFPRPGRAARTREGGRAFWAIAAVAGLVGVADEGEVAVGHVDELARGEREEEGQHEPEVHAEQQAHDGGLPQAEQAEARERDEEEEHGEGDVHGDGCLVVGLAVHLRLEPHEAARADAQGEAAAGAEEDGQGEEVVGRGLSQDVVVDEGERGGHETGEEAVEGRVVELSADEGEAVVRIVAAVAVAVEVAQREGGLDGLDVVGEPEEFLGSGLGGLPEVAHAHAERDQAEAEGEHEEHEHEPVGHDGVEGLGAGMRREEDLGAAREQGAREEDEGGQEGGHEDREAVGGEARGELWGPGEFGVGLAAQPGHDLGVVQVELVRRRVLAGVVAAPAVVAEVGEVLELRVRERAAQFHHRKDRAESLAVAACVADGGTAVRLFHYFRHAASRPATRPKTVPMVIPKPAM